MLKALDIYSARKRIKNFVYKTPLEKSYYFSDLISGKVFLKLECQQIMKAYKIRGALNKLLSLTNRQKGKGIIAASSGNHGACVSFASKLLGIKNVNIFIPECTPKIKRGKIARFGANMIVQGENYDETYAIARNFEKKGKSVWIDSCSDSEVIAGQGTIGLEMIEQYPKLDKILVPIGGGGMITGIAVAVKSINPEIKIIGVQTEACPAMFAAIRDNKFYESYPTKPSICEALVGGVGKIPFKMAENCIDEVLLVKEKTIKKAVINLIEHDKVLSEPSAAVGIACLMDHRDYFSGETVGVVISGGNIDTNLLKSMLNGNLKA